MDEKRLAQTLQRKLSKSLMSYGISNGESILYKIFIDDKGHIRPPNPKKPSRGHLAFETDILIKQRATPLVIMELKYKSLTTHDVLTYSTKALKHKEIYPYIRYGLVVYGYSCLPGRFFTHNVGFDYAFVMNNMNSDYNKLLSIIRSEIKASKRLIKIYNGDKIKLFHAPVKLG